MKIIDHNTGTTHEYSEAEFNMFNLQCIDRENKLSMEQRNAIEYGIAAIKTLKDAGVIE